MQQLSHIDKKTRDALDDLVNDIKEVCKEEMVSVYLYGSAAGKGYIPERSNLNTLVLLKKIEIGLLKSIARIYKKRSALKFAAPLVLTPEYIRASTDAFPIEFLDIKEKAVLLTGEEIWNDISIDLFHLRDECEREIKGQLVRFRGVFLEAEGDLKGMERLVVTAISNLVFPLKNVLRLLKQDIPDDNEAVIKSCCKALNVTDTPLLEALEMKKGGSAASLDDLYKVVSGYMNSLDDISKKIDAMKSEGRL